MSIFHPARLICGECGTPSEVTRSASVNADRRPDLRDTILDGTFQAATCPKCSASIKLEPHLTYMDMENGLWIVAAEASRQEEWPAIEEETRETYESSFGETAPASGQSLGETLSPRLVFGWPALREKIQCALLGLDDVTLELAKMALIRNVANAPMADETELRLTGGTPETLDLAWIETATERELSTLAIPRTLYDGIADDEAWTPLRSRFDGALLIDLRRFLVGPQLTEAAE